MSIASEMTNLAANRDAIKAAIEAKNPSVAPTSALSSFPAAIASIPTGGGGGWQPPSDWPDIKAALQTYPTGATAAESNAIAVLFDCLNATHVRVRRGTTYRFSDSPTTVSTMANPTSWVTHAAPSGTRWLWAIIYSANSVFGDPDSLQYSTDGTTYTGATIARWLVGKGTVESRGWNWWGPKAIEGMTLTFNKNGGGGGYFQGMNSIEYFDATIGTMAVTDLASAFNGCWCLKDLSMLKNLDTSAVTKMSSMFANCASLATLDMSGWDVSSVTTMSDMFYNCFVTSLIGGASEAPAADASKGPRVSLNLAGPQLDRPSVLWLLSWVADLNTLGLSAQTLTLSNYAKQQVTAAEIAVATAKGWTVA